MKSLVFVASILIFNFSLSAQNFVGQPVNYKNQALLKGLFKDYEVVNLDIAAIQASLNTRSTVKKMQIQTSKHHWDLILFEFDIFNKNYFLTKASDEGKVKLPRNKNLRTFKANIQGPRGGLSCMTIADNFLYGFIEESGIKYFYEPLSYFDAKAPLNHIVIYSERDVIPNPNVSCGYEQYKSHLHLADHLTKSDPPSSGSRSACYTVDVALGCDKTIHDNKGGVPQAEGFMIGVLNNVQTNYDNEFAHEVEFGVAATFVPTTTSQDPWNNINNINQHLDIHRSWGNGGGYGTGFAVATAWTRKYTSGAIGLAWLSSVCTNSRYNVCSDFGGGAQSLRVLQAHELGHNFSCGHDPSGSNTIMAPSVNNSNSWSATSISQVNSFLPSRGCLGACSGGLPPEAMFSGSPTSVCVVGKVNFTDESANNPTSWLWTFPGGSPSTSTAQNPMVNYSTRGIYPVTLRATNSFGNNTVTYQDYIEVEQKPNIVRFDYTLIDRELQITNVTQFYGESFLWKFGDGNTSTEELPFHEYSNDGTYNLELIVSNKCGSANRLVRLVVASPVSADFTSDVQQGCAKFTVKYKNLSSSNSTGFKWEFPGGSPATSMLKDPIVVYERKGEFDVKLTASNSLYQDIRSVVKYIKSDSITTSDFYHEDPVGNLVKFKTLTPDADSTLWNFGDGKKSTEIDPEHIFPGPGKYNVCLVVKNICGKDTSCQEVEIPNTLTAKFSLQPNVGCAQFKVKFKNASTGASSYLWSFPGGNPSASTDFEPEVIYDNTGSYDVVLKAINGLDTMTYEELKYVEVKSVPTAEFQTSITGLTVFFNNSSKYGEEYEWSFGDGEKSNEINPSHTYKAEGDFEVILKVKNVCGETEYRKQMAVLLIPRVDFSSKTEICAGDRLTFSDLSSNDVIDWLWQFEKGEPAESTEKNPSVFYEYAGKYSVKLTVKNTNGENFVIKVAYLNVLSPVKCPDRSKKKTKNSATTLDDEDFEGSLHQRNSTFEEQSFYFIQPNPTSQFFNLKAYGIDPNEKLDLKIMDLTGREVYNLKGSANNILDKNIDVSDLRSGVYMVFVNDGENQFTTRLMIVD
ncbi:MAG: PKD domain-containing protein [Saprospiraceae bacterium]|nr:PKD domain-containing protein [Saprospiraceae bacterium]